MKSKLKGNLMLFTAAIIWGTAFVVQKEGMNYLGPIAFNGIRTIIGGIFLIPVIIFMSRKKAANNENSPSSDHTTKDTEEIAAEKKEERRLLLTGGIVCGIALTGSSTLEAYGKSLQALKNACFLCQIF